MTKSPNARAARFRKDDNNPTRGKRARGAGADPESARPGRAGHVNITGYFDSSVRASLYLIQAKVPSATLRDLLAEALNLLFEKYDVPRAAPRPSHLEQG